MTVASIGTPLLGTKSLLGGDIVLRSSPWNQTWTKSETSIPVGDTIDNLGPARHQAAARIRNGDVPAWDPLPAGGSELAAVPSFSIASPLNLPYLLFPSRVAPAFSKLLELIVVLVGFVLFFRRLNAGHAAGLFAGIAFAFSGFQVVWTNWPHTQTIAFAPLLFWASERALQDRHLTAVVPIALSIAAMVAGGFPAVTAHVIYALIFYLLVRSLFLLTSRAMKVRDVVRAGALIVAGLLVGVGLLGAELGPFIDQVDERDLTYREGYGSDPLPTKALVTAAIPHAYGSPNQGRYYGPINPMETLAFVGTSTIFLAGLGALLGRRRRNPPGTALALALLAVFLTVTLFFGGSALTAANWLPTISTNAIGRMRGIWGFVIAAAGGLGLQGVLDSFEPGVDESRSSEVQSGRDAGERWSQWIAVAYICGGALLTLYVGLRIARTGAAEGEGFDVRLGVVVAVFAFAAMSTLWLVRNRLGFWLGPLAIAVLSAEVLFFVIPFWPRIDTERVIPETTTHAYLIDNIGRGRVVNDGLTLYTGTTGYFGLRTVTGHIFHDDTWREMLLAVDPGAFNATRTFSFINLSRPGTLQSPVLDRLGASHAVVTLDAAVPGTFVPAVGDIDGTTLIDSSTAAVATFDSRPVRAVVVEPTDGIDFSRDSVAGFHVKITSGEFTIEASRRILSPIPSSRVHLAIAGEDLPRAGQMTVEVSTFGLTKPVAINAGAGGEPAFGLIEPSDDGLKLVFSEGAAVYERLNALDRFQWAPNSVVIEDVSGRLATLSKTLDKDVVVLSNPPATGHSGSGMTAVIGSVDESDPDVLKIELSAAGSGWLVVRDALQGGWIATVDGEPAALVEADHAVVAVEVPEGTHTVQLRYSPDNGRTGLVVSLLSMAALALFMGFGYVRRHAAVNR